VGVSPGDSTSAPALPQAVAGVLGVPHLYRLWSRTAGAEGQVGASDSQQWAADQLTIHGLGLGLHETLEFLYARPSVADFEAWILERNGGAIDPQQVALVNARVARLSDQEPEPVEAGLPADFEPVLGEAELLCWQEHGYIVLRDAVPPEACRAAEQALWEFLGMDPAVPDGWYQNPHGHTIMVPLFHDRAFAENRRSPQIHTAFRPALGNRRPAGDDRPRRLQSAGAGRLAVPRAGPALGHQPGGPDPARYPGDPLSDRYAGRARRVPLRARLPPADRLVAGGLAAGRQSPHPGPIDRGDADRGAGGRHDPLACRAAARCQRQSGNPPADGPVYRLVPARAVG